MRNKSTAKRIIAFAVVTAMVIPNALATSKEISVWGARSINNYARSDMHTTMEDLQEDYEAFRSTDGLVEYFHTATTAPVKSDMGEAYSWLIDNNILNRDEFVNINKVSLKTVPDVSISKNSMADMYNTVNRSDAIMYIYKAVFGPIWARTIGVETANVRVDNGRYKTLAQMIVDHNGSTNLNHYESSDRTVIINDSTNWRYTPQGNVYTSIFGDTNVFITQNDITMRPITGNGGAAIGDNSVGGGGGDVTLNYNTDYKGIYFRPGADLWFYRTNDVVEVYIQAALSKGLLYYDKHLRTQLFDDTFYPLTEDSAAVASWSPDAVPYIFNRSKTPVYEVVNTEYAPMQEVLGKNYTLSQNGSGYMITRNNMYNSNTGYFSTEKLYKMDVYRYIYTFIYANEKKLSDLERDIVNYKYGMELDGLAEEDDVEIIKYLVAKGILNYESSSEFQELNSPIYWKDFIEVLYRVANPNARFDFSQVQLTDSETAWKAKGYMPQTMYVIEDGAFGDWGSGYDDDEDVQPEDGTEGTVVGKPESRTTAEAVPEKMMVLASSTNKVAVTEGLSLNNFSTSENADGYTQVNLAAVQNNVYVVGTSTLILLGDYRYSCEYTGLEYVEAIADTNHLVTWFTTIRKQLDEGNDRYYEEAMKCVSRSKIITPASFNTDNLNDYSAIHVAITMTLNNIHTVCRIRSDPDIQRKITETVNTVFSSANCKTEKSIEFRKMFLSQFKKVYAESNGLNINYYRKDDTQTKWTTYGFNNVKDWLDNTTKAQLYYVDSQGKGTTYVITFVPSNDSEFDIDINKYRIESLAQNVRDVETHSGNSIHVRLYYSDGDKAGAYARLSRAVTLSNIYNSNSNSYIGSDGKIYPGDKPAEGTDVAGSSGSSSSATGGSGTDGSAQEPLTAFVDPKGKDAFISWDSIKSYNESVTDPSMQIPITQVSDLLLYNSKTDTYAYFSDQEAKKIALVGTAVVVGDPQLGVAFKSGDGESATYYYHINALRLLIDAEQELRVLSGVRGFELPSQLFADSVTTVPLASESGFNEYGVSGVMARISENDSADSAGLSPDSPYFLMDAINNQRWAEFLTLSQANRVMNIITRRITYQTEGSEDMNGAYAVVVFEPVDVTTLGTQPVTSNMSMQDMLDSAALPPSAGRAQWLKNKALCNAYANWIYGTSGQDYIGTGYLLPKAYLYIAPDSDPAIPTGFLEPLTKEQQNSIKKVQLEEVSGRVLPLGSVPGTMTSGVGISYRLSEDYRVLVAGDRVYMNAGAFTGLEPYKGVDGSYSYKLANSAMVAAPFTIGSSFKTTVGDTLTNGMVAPDITVIKTTKDGKITCQVGPVVGTPGKANTNLTGIIGVDKLHDKTTKNFNEFVNNPVYDNLKVVKTEMFTGFQGLQITSIVKDPYLTLSGPVEGAIALYDGYNVKVYDDGNLKYPVVNVKLGAPSDYKSADSYATAMTNAINSKGNLGITSDDVEAYMQIEFPAYQYTVKNGQLTKSNAQASDYLSPALFTSLNDLVIDEMITASNGAVPINEVPAGSLLKVGTGYYTAVGTSKDSKSFIGYSALPADNAEAVYKVKVQNAAMSFATHFIRAGNQYVNVSHFFKEFTVLGANTTDTQNNALGVVADSALAIDGRTKYELDADGNISVITGATEDTAGQKYAPVEIKFDNMLVAYRVSAPDSDYPRYEIVSFAKNSTSGAFRSLPFWTDNLLTATMWDQTTTLLEARFKLTDSIEDIMQIFQDNFGAAFRGDLFTLARLIVFVILCWLMVASWICFTFKMGGLRPMLETIYSPTTRSRGGGIDLLKVISAGTITIDSEFTIGRFIQYNLVLAILILVVWKSGVWFG